MKENKEVEKCISCGQDTQYYINDDVSFRRNYIDGAGQLCTKCAGKVNESLNKIISTEKKEYNGH